MDEHLLDLLEQLVSHVPVLFICTNTTRDQYVRVSADKTQEILAARDEALASNPSVTLDSIVTSFLHDGTLTPADTSAPADTDFIHCYLQGVLLMRW